MRTILLPLSGTDLDAATLDAGFDLAGTFDARITALLPLPPIGPVPVYGDFAGAVGMVQTLEHVRAEADVRRTHTEQLVAETARRHGLALGADPAASGPAVDLIVEERDAEAAVRRWAAVHDLILFRRVGDGAAQALPATPLLKATLEGSGRPVLLVTDDLPPRFDRKVAIFWNGSVEGARAVSAALPFLRGAGQVVIVTVNTDKTPGAEGERLRTYLAHHGLRAELDVRTGIGAVGETLMRAAGEHDAGLIVTGGYTHSRMRQSLFGGVTSHLLANCRTPLLMAH